MTAPQINPSNTEQVATPSQNAKSSSDLAAPATSATAPPPESVDTNNVSDTQGLLDVENELPNKNKTAESRETWETFS